MDGFALRQQDLQQLPVDLQLSCDIPAGADSQEKVKPGMCIRIMTGAPIPSGADTVVPVEWTEELHSQMIRFHQRPALGAYIRRAAQDARRGTVVAEKGKRITPPLLGMIASAGYHNISVGRIPKVVIIVTGDELLRIHLSRSHHQRFEIVMVLVSLHRSLKWVPR